MQLLNLAQVDLLHLPDRLPQRGELPAGGAGLGLRRRALVEVPVWGPGHQVKVLEVTLGINNSIFNSSSILLLGLLVVT